MRALLSVQEKLHILTLAMTLAWQEVPGNLNALGDITVYLGSKLAVPGGTRLSGIMEQHLSLQPTRKLSSGKNGQLRHPWVVQEML